MRKTSIVLAWLLSVASVIVPLSAEEAPYAKDKIEPPTAEWRAKIAELAPAQPTVAAPKRKVLVFSLFTGYPHAVTPHVDVVMQEIGEKSGAYDADVTRDIRSLAAENLARYDVLVLNNNCSKDPGRNIFLDVLKSDKQYEALSDAERLAQAKVLEKGILDFVAGGKGVVAIHGAITIMNGSKEFAEMLGAGFDYHPPNQKLTLRTVEAEHPLAAAFRGDGLFVHRDEPYLFSGPYAKLDFRPLLVLETKGIQGAKPGLDAIARYVAWIKPYGRGRVFFCSPSHFPESYESAAMLRFLLDGVQYAAGDLKCDDSTPQKTS